MRTGSSSESALRVALRHVEALGGEIKIISGDDLVMPMYEYGSSSGAQSKKMIDAVKWADSLILSTPGYHGGPSGLMKNALDHLEELRAHERPYLDGMAVGCIAVAEGWQAAVNAIQGLRTIVHALRGWPTPYGATINNSSKEGGVFDRSGDCRDETVRKQLETVAEMVVSFGQSVRK